MYEDVAVDLPHCGGMLRGRLALPRSSVPAAVVVLLGALGSTMSTTWPAARAFLSAGLGALVYDHRGTGDSDGEPRREIDPHRMAGDLAHVLSWLQEHPDVDAGRVGLCGLSLGATVCLLSASTDPRVGAVAAALPPVRGFDARRLHTGRQLRELDHIIEWDRLARAGGQPPCYIPLYPDRPGQPSIFGHVREDPAARHQFDADATDITIASIVKLAAIDVSALGDRIHVPTVILVADRDVIAPVADAQHLFRQIAGPKELRELPGGHHLVLARRLPEMMRSSARFLAQHLRPSNELDGEGATRTLQGPTADARRGDSDE